MVVTPRRVAGCPRRVTDCLLPDPSIRPPAVAPGARIGDVSASVRLLTQARSPAQFEDGVLLEGRLSEYRDLFQSCPSWRKDGPGLGMIERSCVVGLAGRLEHPLPQAEARNALQTFCDSRACRVPDEPLTFADFLNMFRDDLLDLQQIEEYMKLEADPHPSFSPDEVRMRSLRLCPDVLYST